MPDDRDDAITRAQEAIVGESILVDVSADGLLDGILDRESETRRALKGPLRVPEGAESGEEISDGRPANEVLSALAGSLRDNFAFRAAVARRVQQRPVVQNVPLMRPRRITVGIAPEIIEPGRSVFMVARPGCLFKTEKVVNTGDEEDLVVESISVGNVVVVSEQPVRYFSQSSSRSFDWVFPVCEVNDWIGVRVRNGGMQRRRFSMSFVGKALF